jgi:UDP-2-acetamido-3-amino-2,3-dideoxy-glucuronate N-acetyltransferase
MSVSRPGVVLGHTVKLQNHALVYEPARLGDGMFLGPGRGAG